MIVFNCETFFVNLNKENLNGWFEFNVYKKYWLIVNCCLDEVEQNPDRLYKNPKLKINSKAKTTTFHDGWYEWLIALLLFHNWYAQKFFVFNLEDNI